MGKNIYDMLNDVEIDLNEYDKKEFNDIEKRKLKNNFKYNLNKPSKNKKSIHKKGIAVALVALLTIGIFGTSLGRPVLANINMIFYDIASGLGIEKNLDEYKTVVNKAITKDDLTIQLNEVILDHEQLVVTSTLTANEKLDESGILVSGNVYINGKKVSNGVSGSSKQIDEYTMEDVMSYDINDDLSGDFSDEFSGDLNIKVVLSNPMINKKTKKEKWVFEFKTNGDELALDTKEILLDNTFTLENGQKITLEKYTSNNLGQKIYFIKDSKDTDYDMMLQGNDDLGNKIEFSLRRTRGCTGIFKLENIDGNLNERAKTLSLTPYAVKFPEESGRLSNDFKKVGEEFTIELAK